MDTLTLLLVIGATLRLTHLVTVDDFPPMVAIRRRVGRVQVRYAADQRGDYWLWTLITCPWCASFWAALFVVATATHWGAHWSWRLIAGALTLSLLAGTFETLMAKTED